MKAVLYINNSESFILLCLILWLICFIARFAFHMGLVPVFCISGIWLVLVLSYSISAYWLEYEKKKSSGKENVKS